MILAQLGAERLIPLYSNFLESFCRSSSLAWWSNQRSHPGTNAILASRVSETEMNLV
jgi:hypothetical protein